MKTVKYIIAALTAMSLLSCTRDEQQMTYSYDNDPDAVVVTASVASTKVNTEAAGDAFTEGDSFMVENTAEGINEYRSNAKYQYSGDAWKLVGEQYMHWADGYNYFQAWMPAGAAYNAFTIPADQSSVAGLRSADWMTAAVNGVEKTKNQSIDLEFSHKLAKVVVTVTEFKAPYTSEEAISNAKFAVAGKGISGEISIVDGANEIAAYISDKSMSAVLAPGVYEVGKTFLTLNVGGDALIVEAPQAGIALEAGKSYKFTLTVENNRPRISGVTVNDWNEAVLEGVGADEEIIGVTVKVPENEIWYVMSDGSVYDVYQTTNTYGHSPFDAEVISNTYENGRGVIRFASAVTRINDHTFGNSWAQNMVELYLPDCIESLGTGAISHTGLTTLRIPANLKTVESYALNSRSINPLHAGIKSFTGHHISADGKCVILEDSTMVGFAPNGITEYSIPEGVKSIDAYCFAWYDIESVIFPEGLEYIGGDAFAECKKLKSVTLPSTIENISSYAFRECTAIEGFYGNEKFHTPDNKCLIFMQDIPWQPAWNGPWICGFAGAGITEYTIPDGIVGIENYAFSSGVELKSVTLPSTLVKVGSVAFNGCSNLEAIYGDMVSEDHRCIIYGNRLENMVARKNLPKNYVIPENITEIGYAAFENCSEIESIMMGDQVTKIEGYAFGWCYNLKSLTLSAGLTDLSDVNFILGSTHLESVYLRAPFPPLYTDTQMDVYPDLTIYVPQESLEMYRTSPYWRNWKDYFEGYEYTDLPELNIDYYYSTDYSRDGKVTTVQTATVGNGVDLILMGDAYSDRQIADGTYRAAMDKAIEAMFSEEPYKSHRNMFNIYVVDVVSLTEGYDHGGQALSTFFGGGTYVGGDDNLVMEYTLNAISEERLDEALMVVMMNRDYYAGTCWMYYPSSGDYGNGPSVAYFPTSSDEATFNGLMLHEAGGHGFAKLEDEYAYEYMGAYPKSEVAQRRTLEGYGWWKNTDLTNDVNIVKWSHFLVDERYQYDGLGVFEGASTYWTGAWRPTENSIMRYNEGGFNAPSREAIYTRIHKLAYGESWQYNYEDFVAYDEINRKTAEEAAAAAARPQNIAPWRPTTPPVVVGKTWREAMEDAK